MRIIKLTCQDKSLIYINVEQIGHFYEIPDKMDYGRVTEAKHTKVGVTTHNNGGFKVIESADKIIKLINDAKLLMIL
jgi:hypothetical protein